MRQSHCIYPYHNDHRELLMTMPYEIFCPKRVTLYCDALNAGCMEGQLISRGQCIGFMEECPVYASIDGRVESIIPINFKFNHSGFSVHISMEKHGESLWSELPFYDHIEGSMFLRQLGVKKGYDHISTDVLWVDGVESDPASACVYRLLIEEPVKIILGADVLAKYFHSKKVIFCIEKDWMEVAYILGKNLKKYQLLLDEHIEFKIKKCVRQYPMAYNAGGHFVIKPHLAVHAYNGRFEHQGILDTWVCVRGLIGHQGNFMIPVGTHISDLLLYCHYEYQEHLKIVANGLLSGYSVSDTDGVVDMNMTGLCVLLFSGTSEKACLHCRRCAAVCPLHLKPYDMTVEMAEACIHCGCCSYVCPSGRRLSEYARRRVNPEKPGRGGHRRDAQKHRIRAMYVELAPEFADSLPQMSVESDAAPYIREPQTLKMHEVIAYASLLVVVLCALILYPVQMLVRISFSLASSIFGAEILYMTHYGIRRGKIYHVLVFWALFFALIFPPDTSLLWIVFANIIACILEIKHL